MKIRWGWGALALFCGITVLAGFNAFFREISVRPNDAVQNLILGIICIPLTGLCLYKAFRPKKQPPQKTKPKAKSKPKAQPAASRSTVPLDDMAYIDQMDGHAFEHFVADLLQKIGYERVEVTRGSGDQGVDILARKAGARYAIQCKRYAKKLGNKPVQEAFAGKSIYGCNVAVVVTNNYFTEGAKEAARSTGVLLWDRDMLKRMIRDANWKNM